MSHESGSCLGFEHHSYHDILSISRMPCIRQVLGEYLWMNEPPPPLLLNHPLLFSCRTVLTAAVPQCSAIAFLTFSLSRCLHTFPHQPLTCGPHVLVRLQCHLRSFVEAIPCMALHQCRVKSQSEFICSSMPVTSPFFKNFVLFILTYLSSQQSDQLCL